MVQAEIGKQLMISVSDSVGSLAEVTAVVSSSGINILALCAYEVAGVVAIMFTTEDNNTAKRLLEEQGCNVQEEEIIILSLDNQPGALQKVTDKLADAGIDLRLMYGSVEKDAEKSIIVIISENNLEAMKVIKTEIERG